MVEPCAVASSGLGQPLGGRRRPGRRADAADRFAPAAGTPTSSGAASAARRPAGGTPGSGAAKDLRKAEHRRARRRPNLIQRLKRRHEALEAKIQTVEGELARLSERISAAGEAGDVERVERLGRGYQEEHARLTAMCDEWEGVGLELEKHL